MTTALCIEGFLLLLVIFLTVWRISYWHTIRKLKRIHKDLMHPDPNVRRTAYKRFKSSEGIQHLAVANLFNAIEKYDPSRPIDTAKVDFIVNALALTDPNADIRRKAEQHFGQTEADALPPLATKPTRQTGNV